tara:strand:+ start:76755 stop:78182 length:1428 start_codon:yes stop_codon:yes gene_type:complete
MEISTVTPIHKKKNHSLKSGFHNFKFMKRALLLFVSIVCIGNCLAQSKLRYDSSIEMTGLASSNDSLPLWFYTNSGSKIGRESNFAALLDLTASHSLTETSELSAGVSLFYRDNVPDEFQRNELYLQFENSWLAITAGAKEVSEVALGLSATNKNFLMSGNSRPLPGIRIASSSPLKLTDVFGLDFGISHYEFNDDRFVDNVRLHQKHIAVITTFNESHQLTAKLQHFAQWAGTSPVFGKLKSDVSGFVDVFTARESPELGVDGEIFNAVGNHLGSYLLDYEFKTSFGTTSLYHEHPFEDGSGTALANFPDGVWGVFLQPAENSIVDGVLYEFITTKSQSGTSGGSAFDNYFNNSVYRSGWTNEGIPIGLPFTIVAPVGTLDEDQVKFISNTLSMHHIGLTGKYKVIDWKIKSSFVRNFGRLAKPFSTTLVTSHHYLELTHTTAQYGRITLMTGFDTNNTSESIFGAALQYRYQF